MTKDDLPPLPPADMEEYFHGTIGWAEESVKAYALAAIAAHDAKRKKDAERLLREAQNALLDYVERLEKQGGMMNYGRKVLREIKAYIEREGA